VEREFRGNRWELSQYLPKTPQESEMTHLQAASSIVIEVEIITVKLALSKKQSFVFITLFLSVITTA